MWALKREMRYVSGVAWPTAGEALLGVFTFELASDRNGVSLESVDIKTLPLLIYMNR
jgi:hypothetical protein